MYLLYLDASDSVKNPNERHLAVALSTGNNVEGITWLNRIGRIGRCFTGTTLGFCGR